MSIILNIKRHFVNFYLLYPSLAILSIIIETFILFQNPSVITDTFTFFINPSVIPDTFAIYTHLTLAHNSHPYSIDILLQASLPQILPQKR